MTIEERVPHQRKVAIVTGGSRGIGKLHSIWFHFYYRPDQPQAAWPARSGSAKIVLVPAEVTSQVSSVIRGSYFGGACHWCGWVLKR